MFLSNKLSSVNTPYITVLKDRSPNIVTPIVYVSETHHIANIDPLIDF